MNRYTIYCTPEQTRKAFELGAPLNSPSVIYMDDKKNKENHIVHCMKGNPITFSGNFIIPTTEQMIGWLEKQGLFVETYYNGEARYNFSGLISTQDEGELIQLEAMDSRKEAILAAIDAALEYLSNKSNK